MNRKLLLLIGGIVCVALFIINCSDKSTTPDRPDTRQSPSEPVPDNVAQYITTNSPDELQLAEELIEELSSNNTTNISDYDIYAVTFVWGALFDPSGTSPATDWSGELTSNAVGNVDIAYPIDFEANQDQILPTDIVTKAAWVSSTEHGDIDGIICMVAVDRSVDYFAAPALTFSTGPFTHTFYFDELDEFAALYPVDQKHAVAVVSKLLWHPMCEGGVISGSWTKDDIAGATGSISGVWYDYTGTPVGIMNGMFETANDSQRTFSGWVSGYITTEVILEFEGKWMYDDYRECVLCGAGHGLFWGRYAYVSEDKSGYIQGTFGDYSLPVEELALPINGVWQDKCILSPHPEIE